MTDTSDRLVRAHRFSQTLCGSSEVLAPLRHDLREWLIAIPLSSTLVTDVLLVVGEIVTNSVEHGYGRRRGTLHVDAYADGVTLEVIVSDEGRWQAPKSDRLRGRGLQLVKALTTSSELEYDACGTTVRASWRLCATAW